MSPHIRNTAILLVKTSLRRGIAAAITEFIHDHGGLIVYHDQYVEPEEQLYFTRIEWELEEFTLPEPDIAQSFGQSFATEFDMDWQLYFSKVPQRVALFVSKISFCFTDFIARFASGEWNIEIPLIISNHLDMQYIAEKVGIEYHHIPITNETKPQQEARELALLEEKKIDLIVLARYMQVLSSQMIVRYPNQIINIHHSFLPAFRGAKPYHAAHAHGVKLIGATSHYVSEELDKGPIISQDAIVVTHRDSVDDLIRKGRDLERLVLSRAIRNHLQRKIIVYNNRTIVFAD